MDAYLHVNDFYLPRNTCIYMYLHVLTIHVFTPPIYTHAGGRGYPEGDWAPGGV